MESVVALRDLVALGGRAADTQQRALMALLEGLVQLHFVSLDELLAEVDATSLPWEELERSTEAALLQWRADSGGVENLYAVG